MRRLQSLTPISEADQAFLLRLGEGRFRHHAGEELILEGQSARRARFVMSGWATSQRSLPDSRRQIFGFAFPGDGFGICLGETVPALSSVVAATPMETIDAEPIIGAVRAGQAPSLERALALAARMDDMLLMDHVMRLGRQTAYERVAHLLLELQERTEMAGLGNAQRFPLPLTQEVLADTLGLSIVHVNRTLQQLRRERLIEWRSGVVVLLNKPLLVSVADYRSLAARLHPPVIR
jgi:CRP-like cAMP-binding protein